MTGKLPERRSYTSSDVYQNYLYVFGGQDLKEGTYNSVWRINLKVILDGGNTSWDFVKTSGQCTPKPLSHHNGFIANECFYNYGGIHSGDSNSNVYILNLKTNEWTIL